MSDPRPIWEVAGPHYDRIRDQLERFAAVHGLEYAPWHQDGASFQFRWPKSVWPIPPDLVVRGIVLTIEVGDYCTVVKIEGSVFSDTFNSDGLPIAEKRRLRSFLFMKGKLSRDESHITPWLEAARAVLNAVTADDLLDVSEWREDGSKFVPLLEIK